MISSLIDGVPKVHWHRWLFVEKSQSLASHRTLQFQEKRNLGEQVVHIHLLLLKLISGGTTLFLVKSLFSFLGWGGLASPTLKIWQIKPWATKWPNFLFFASQDALELRSDDVRQWWLADFTDVTLVSDDIYWKFYWCHSGAWGY